VTDLVLCDNMYIPLEVAVMTISYIYFKIIDVLSATFKDRQIGK
jgi:hypothetical protein